MNETFTYKEEELLFEGRKVQILRAYDRRGQRSVILKRLLLDQELPHGINRLRSEYTIIKSLDLPHVRQALGFERIEGRTTLILEDVAGVPLRDELRRSALSLKDLLSLFIQIARALGSLHDKHVIHKDINPDNILINRAQNKIWFIDFDLACILPREIARPVIATELAGSLPYISPEQTGRIAQSLDHRSDFYSLGITFYEALAGRLPFLHHDSAELVYAHIALVPESPQLWNPLIPDMLAQIVMKLVEKSPERRYESAFGLESDLERCLRSLEQGAPHPFPLGENDQIIRFVFPEGLVGRQVERAALKASLDRVARGAAEMVVISGEAGIGKSSLMRDLGTGLLRNRAVFVEGKFDQYRRDVPYDAIAAALDQYLRSMETWTDQERDRLLERLQTELGSTLDQFANLVPELARLCQLQSRPLEVPAERVADPRSVPIFLRRVIQIFTQHSKLLVLFLDDLQWADLDSLEVLRDLLVHPDTASLLLITAHRSLDQRSGSLLEAWTDDLDQARVTRLSLGPLLGPDLEELLGICFRGLEAPKKGLAAVLLQKTRGNPFFIRQLIETLYQEGIVRAEGQKWTVDLTKLEATTISENVVTLLIKKLEKLPDGTRELLQAASCLGSSFSLGDLALARRSSVKDLKEMLDRLVADEFLIPMDARYHAWFDTDAGDPSPLLTFAHDRVQEAAHQTIAAADLPQLHLNIANALDQGLRAIDSQAFALIRHFNGAESLIKDSDRRLDLARWNLRIARRAREAGSYQTSLHLCEIGLRFVGEGAWDRHEDLMRELCTLAGENCHLSKDYGRAEQYFAEASENSRSLLAKACVHEAQCHLYNLTRQYKSALKIGREILQKFGLPLPRRVSVLKFIYYRYQSHRLLFRSKVDILKLPPVTDEKIEVVQRILIVLSTSAYFEDPSLTAAIAALQIRLALRYGMHPGLAIAVHSNAAGLIFSYAPVKARTSAERGRELLKEQGAGDSGPRSYLVWGLYVGHWYRPIDEILSIFSQGFQLAMAKGAINEAVSLASSQSILGFLAGRDLQLSVEKLKTSLALLPEHENALETALKDYFELLGSPDINLDQLSLDALPREDKNEKPHERLKLNSSRFLYWHVRTMIEAIKGDKEETLRAFKLAAKYSYLVGGIPGLWSFQTLGVMIIGQSFEKWSRLHRILIRIGIAITLRFRSGNVRNCPENFRHQYDLMRAESARMRKVDTGTVVRFYRSAIVQARRFDFNSYEAMAAERLGSLYEELNDPLAAQQCYLTARRAYERWGIAVKVRAIDARYPEVAKLAEPIQSLSGTGSSSGRGISSVAFDVPLLIKASQALSAEIRESALLERLLRLVVEHAGARRAVLLLRDDAKRLKIKARIDVAERSEVTLDDAEPTAAEMPLSLLQRVLRSSEVAVISDAAEASKGFQDPYFEAHGCRSVLCMPIFHKAQLYGLLYLENELIAGAFREERVALLNVLCGQMTVSLENARLYRDVASSLEAEKTARESEQKALEAEKGARRREQEAHDDWVRSEGARAELASSIEAARAVQEALLETGGTIPGCELAWFYRPAERAGGDWFGNYYLAEHGRLYMCVADVTGHGIPSALVTAAIAGATASAIAALKMRPIADKHEDLATIARAVNEAVLHTGARANRSATMVLLALDVAKGEGAILYAAHPLAYLRSQAKVKPLMGRGNLLGIKHEPSFETSSFHMAPGDILFLYSDGLTENEDKSGKSLRVRNLMKVVEEAKDLTHMVQSLTEKIEDFVQNKTTDDTTFVALQWEGKRDGSAQVA